MEGVSTERTEPAAARNAPLLSRRSRQVCCQVTQKPGEVGHPLSPYRRSATLSSRAEAHPPNARTHLLPPPSHRRGKTPPEGQPPVPDGVVSGELGLHSQRQLARVLKNARPARSKERGRLTPARSIGTWVGPPPDQHGGEQARDWGLLPASGNRCDFRADGPLGGARVSTAQRRSTFPLDLHQQEPLWLRSAIVPFVSAEEIAANIRFVVDNQGRVTSVVLTPELWRELVEGLEDAEDRKLLRELAPKLSTGPDDAIRWTDVERDWA
jgi:hypothetical protein